MKVDVSKVKRAPGYDITYQQVEIALFLAIEKYKKIRFYFPKNLLHILRSVYVSDLEQPNDWPEYVNIGYFMQLFNAVRLDNRDEIHFQRAKQSGEPNYLWFVKHRRKDWKQVKHLRKRSY